MQFFIREAFFPLLGYLQVEVLVPVSVQTLKGLANTFFSQEKKSIVMQHLLLRHEKFRLKLQKCQSWDTAEEEQSKMSNLGMKFGVKIVVLLHGTPTSNRTVMRKREGKCFICAKLILINGKSFFFSRLPYQSECTWKKSHHHQLASMLLSLSIFIFSLKWVLQLRFSSRYLKELSSTFLLDSSRTWTSTFSR